MAVEAEPKILEAIVQPKIATKTLRYQTFTAIVSEDETITLEIGTLTADGHAVFKLSDGTAIGHSVATNKITITESPCVDVHVAGIAIGQI